MNILLGINKLFAGAFIVLLLAGNGFAGDEAMSNAELARQILSVEAMALKSLASFNAGTSYGEIWIRDFNTFIDGSLRVHDKDIVKDKLLLFFKIQGADGNVPDGAIKSGQANVGYKYRYSDLAPGWAAHKNTVETDQESSLVQAVQKYIVATGDKTILTERIGGQTVIARMDAALQYVLKNRWSEKYGLVIGATTVDWGDMQAQAGWGVVINAHTKWAIDIYDNAMFLMAINDLIAMTPKDYHSEINWKRTAQQLKKNIRKYLWDAKAQKYIPHIYLNGSPFAPDFNEREILYTGGTTCAILAGLNSRKEILAINEQFVAMTKKEKFATIGMTVYPPYPLKAFPNVPPYTYQNGGDWTWFGGRMIQALIENGFVTQAYAEMIPMIDRVLKNNGFFEWYDVKTGKPEGSRDFHGSAGVLYEAIEQLKTWAKNNSK
jgi:Mannosylglycerate hydrolase MGH1-like glycoside hydrolase domain